MYVEGVKIGNNSYILSDEDGTLTLLNGKCTKEETEEYIKLKNSWEEELQEYRELQSILSEKNELDKIIKRINIKVSVVTILAELLSLLITGGSLDSVSIIMLPSLPLIVYPISNILQTLVHGTKKKRKEQKEEVKIKLLSKNEKIKEIENKMSKLKEKIETESYFWQDEIIPVTTVEKEKKSVKMRVLKLEQNRNECR